MREVEGHASDKYNGLQGTVRSPPLAAGGVLEVELQGPEGKVELMVKPACVRAGVGSEHAGW